MGTGEYVPQHQPYANLPLYHIHLCTCIRAALNNATVTLLTSNDIVEGIDLRVGYTATGAQSSQGREPLYDSIGQFVTSNVLGWHSRI